MASEPAEPTTRPQDDVIDKAADAICDAYEVYAPVPGVLRSEAPNIARALADLGLLADPAQTTELAGVVDVPVGSKAYRLINELTADLEQARAQRNEAMETAGLLRDEVREHQVAAANLYSRMFVALGLSITAPWAGLVDAAGRVRAERDALSLLLRGMARKLVAYRKWTTGETPTIHKLFDALRAEASTADDVTMSAIRLMNRAGVERDQRQARIDDAVAKLKAADNLIVDWQPSLEEWAKCVSLIVHARAALVGDQPKAEEPATERVPCGNPDRNCGRLGGSARCGSCRDDAAGDHS